MADEPHTEQIAVKSDSEDLTFETIGKQVQQLALDEAPLPAGFQGRADPTEVIDSLCMNCGKDVRLHLDFIQLELSLLMIFRYRGKRYCS